VSWRAVFTEIFVPSIIPAIPMGGVLYYLANLLQPNSYLSIFFVGGIGLIVYIVGYLMMSAAESERQLLRRLFQTVVRTAQAYRQG
jgi:hypothetical protein